jgi:hypothetical protein
MVMRAATWNVRVTNGSRQETGRELIELWVYKVSDGTIPALEKQRVVLFCADKEMKIN